MTAHPRPELHLPDLPEIPVQLGLPGPDPAWQAAAGQPSRPVLSWDYRLRQALSSYLPLLLMALLAGSTWWLVKHTPQRAEPGPAAAPRQAPDYTMTGFSITRFAPEGRMTLHLAGDVLRHFPATDMLEVEGVRIHAVAPDGRTIDATARRALANGDGSEVQLLGGAHVVSRLEGTDALEVNGEFLHAFLRLEQLRSNQPVQLRYGSTEAHAGGLDYDNLRQQLRLDGPVRARLMPALRTRLPAVPVAPASASAR